MKRAPDCHSMAEIRIEIDRIDEALMRLLAERWTYIGRAAEIKKPVGMPADIPSRVDEVRANIRRHADTLALDADFYDALWSQLIRHSIDHEEDKLGDRLAPRDVPAR